MPTRYGGGSTRWSPQVAASVGSGRAIRACALPPRRACASCSWHAAAARYAIARTTSSLGESPWFRGLYADCAEIRVLLQNLPNDATSITWPDSIASMGLLADYGIQTVDRPQYGSVFLLDELEDVVERYGMPNGEVPVDYDGHQREAFDHFIEVQLWTDEPLRNLGL